MAMTQVLDTEVAWLAGLWDGEGSVGFVATSGKSHTITPTIQLSMTCGETVQKACRIVEAVTGYGTAAYCYRERKTEHRDAHYLRVRGGAAAVLSLGRAMLPYAVTKRRAWEIVLEFTESRIDLNGVDATGRLRRGGRKVAYTPREIELYVEMTELVGRQPGRTGRKARHEWIWDLHHQRVLGPD